jgi:hypothetical protein
LGKNPASFGVVSQVVLGVKNYCTPKPAKFPKLTPFNEKLYVDLSLHIFFKNTLSGKKTFVGKRTKTRNLVFLKVFRILKGCNVSNRKCKHASAALQAVLP